MTRQEKMRRVAGACVMALGGVLGAFAQALAAERQPVERFASLPLVPEVSLSPNGRQIASI